MDWSRGCLQLFSCIYSLLVIRKLTFNCGKDCYLNCWQWMRNFLSTDIQMLCIRTSWILLWETNRYIIIWLLDYLLTILSLNTQQEMLTFYLIWWHMHSHVNVSCKHSTPERFTLSKSSFAEDSITSVSRQGSLDKWLMGDVEILASWWRQHDLSAWLP